MRVVTWNIHGSRDAPLEHIVDEVRALGADVVCLNEVRRRHGKRIGRLLGMKSYVASSFLGPYGNAVYTSEPVADWRRFRFPGTPRIDRRDAAIVTLRSGMTVVAWHLNSLRPAERAPNTSDLLAWVNDRTVIAGDTNETPNDAVARMLSERFVDACGDPGEPTYPASSPHARIDYIWVPRGTNVRSCAVLPTRSSDHRPVVADLDIPTSA